MMNFPDSELHMKPTLHRLFYALKPSPADAARIGRIRNAFGPARTIVDDHRLHATLGITADYPDFPGQVATEMLAIGASIGSDPVSLMLDEIVATERSIALCPGSCPKAWRDLQRQIRVALGRRDILRPGWRANPHLTLLYRAGEFFRTRVPAVALQSADFVLIHSLIGQTRHIELGRWPLLPLQGSFRFAPDR